jgi:hypothetical protein
MEHSTILWTRLFMRGLCARNAGTTLWVYRYEPLHHSLMKVHGAVLMIYIYI